jgi:hypothetical protein
MFMISPFCLRVCIYISFPIVARQRHGKPLPGATNTHTEELLDTSFSMRSVSYEKKIGDLFFPELLEIVSIYLCLGLPGGLLL